MFYLIISERIIFFVLSEGEEEERKERGDYRGDRIER